jgi:CO/xanthine dehydrogenase Mo-binding subunit
MVVAPAVANATHNGAVAGVRHMPITANAVLEPLKKKA